MEKVAIISDVHGNLTALNAVLKDIDSKGITKIYCLGDSVIKCARPDKVVDILKPTKFASFSLISFYRLKHCTLSNDVLRQKIDDIKIYKFNKTLILNNQSKKIGFTPVFFV